MNDTATIDAEAPESTPAESFEVRRRVALAAPLGVASAALAVAYLLRAVGDGGPLDWVVCALMALLATAYVTALLDARAPLLVVDRLGVRIRKGRTWSGVAWPEVELVEHLPRRALLRDGWILVAHDDGDLRVPLSLSTQVVGLGDADLSEALADLSGGATEIVEIDPGLDDEEPEPEGDAAVLDDRAVAPEPLVASPTPVPLRDLRQAVRADLERDPAAGVDDGEDTVVWSEGVPASPGDAAETIVIDEFVVEPAADPVIGPELAAARSRLGLTVDQLSERTRIRPHVIESIEVDDFAPCGGDFYARGHLRTLARVLAVDMGPLLVAYDAKYADAPIDPRRVFEAELAAASGGIRGTRGGPNWSVLVAAVMAVVLVWSVARLVTGDSVSQDPVDSLRLNGSGGPDNASEAAGKPVPVVLTAAGGGARVVARDGDGEIVFDGQLAFGQAARFQATPPVRVSTTDGSLEVNVDGNDEGAVGATGEHAQDVYVVR